MRAPAFHHFKRYSQAIALVCAGMIIGAAVHMILYQNNMTQILTMYDKIKVEKQNLIKKIEDLEKYKDDNTVIKTIVVDIEDPLDEKEAILTDIEKNQIITKVQKYLDVLKGTPISRLTETDNPKIFRSLFGQKRVSNINEKDFVVEIKTMLVIYSELKIRISVAPYRDIE